MAADPRSRRHRQPLWRPQEELERLEELEKSKQIHKTIVSKLLTNITLINLLYSCIHDAAIIATASDDVMHNSNKICSYPIGSPASSRESKECSVMEQYHVKYHPDDILIVGGAAIALYDASISWIKKIKYGNASTIQGYVQKDTSDIDMVWWPRIPVDVKKHVVTINSPAITALIQTYKHALKITFDKKLVTNNLSVLGIIQVAIRSTRPDITLARIEIEESNEGIKAGVKKVLIYFIITFPTMNSLTKNDEMKLEICDISIHDGASSQQHIGKDERGREQLILKKMTFDPIYCIPQTQTTALQLGIGKLYVPNILSILRQQQFAFKNLLYAGEKKCLINYKRILYLQQMIFEYDYQKKNENFKKIFDTPVNITVFIENLNRNLGKTIDEECPRNNTKNSSQLCKTLYDLQATHESELITMQKTHHSKQEQKLHERHRKEENEEQKRTYEYDPQQEQQMHELFQLYQALQQNKPQGGFIRRKQTRRKQTRRKQQRRNKTRKR